MDILKGNLGDDREKGTKLRDKMKNKKWKKKRKVRIKIKIFQKKQSIHAMNVASPI